MDTLKRKSHLAGWIIALIAICTMIFSSGILFQKVEAQEKKDSPSREEFRTLCATVTQMDGKIDQIKNVLIPMPVTK